jgi:hypothetical protein
MMYFVVGLLFRWPGLMVSLWPRMVIHNAAGSGALPLTNETANDDATTDALSVQHQEIMIVVMYLFEMDL